MNRRPSLSHVVAVLTGVPRRSLWAPLSLCLLVFICSSPAGYAEGRPLQVEWVGGRQAAANEVLVGFSGPSARAALPDIARAEDVDRSEPVGRAGAVLIHSRSKRAADLVKDLMARPGPRYVEPNYIVTANATPNDTRLGELWGLSNTGQTINGVVGASGVDIGAPAAWDITTGSTANVVAVVDTGVDYNHPDLAANMWSAPTDFHVTIGGSDILIPAGSHGFNAITNTPDPMDDQKHGTHCAGTIGASGNNGSGVVGVNWTTRIMACKFLDSTGNGTIANAINAIDFAIQAKNALGAGANVRVLSNSWGGTGFSQALLDEINLAGTNDMLVVAAAGNDGYPNDYYPFYPASYHAFNVIAVAAIDNTGALASFSNYGRNSVHLGAPGVSILSTLATVAGGGYGYLNGTSMAAPHVSGTAALALSAANLNAAELKSVLLNNVVATPALTTTTITGGRLNAYHALLGAALPAPSDLAGVPGDNQIALSWTASAGATSYNVKRSTVDGGPYTLIASPTTNSYTNVGLWSSWTYYYIVTAVSPSCLSPDTAQLTVTTTGPPVSTYMLQPAAGDASVALSWYAVAAATSYNVKHATVSGGPYTTVASPTTTSYTDTGLTNGATYYFVVTAVNGGGESTNSNEVSAMPVAPPVNDQCANALVVGALPYTDSQDTISATSTGDPVPACVTAGHGVWYQFTPAFSGQVTVDTVNSNFDTVLAGYTGTCGSMAQFACDDDSAGATRSRIVFTAAAGTTYWFLAAGYNTHSGSLVFNVSTSVPSPPTGLTATSGDTYVSLSWNASAGAASYNVKRSTVNGGPYTTVASPSDSGFTNTGLTNGTTYFYVVSAVNTAESANSSQVSATPAPAPPQAPTGVTATPADQKVTLTWNAASGATGYRVRRGTTNGGPYTTIASVGGTTWANTGLTNGTTYYYVVASFNSAGTGPNSSQASATPFAVIPPVPTITQAKSGDAKVTLYWTASSGATLYRVRRSTVSGSAYTTIASVTAPQWANTGLTNGTTYYYVVAASNSAGTSANSAQASATPLALPAAPTGLSATPASGKVTLSWNAIAGVTGYRVRRSTVSGGPYTTVAALTGTAWLNTGLTNGTTYYYVVAAFNSSGDGPNSTQASATPN